MPNDVMGWTRIEEEWDYDELTIDRAVTWIKHANSDGVEHKIASAAVFRSEGLTKSKVSQPDHGMER